MAETWIAPAELAVIEPPLPLPRPEASRLPMKDSRLPPACRTMVAPAPFDPGAASNAPDELSIVSAPPAIKVTVPPLACDIPEPATPPSVPWAAMISEPGAVPTEIGEPASTSIDPPLPPTTAFALRTSGTGPLMLRPVPTSLINPPDPPGALASRVLLPAATVMETGATGACRAIKPPLPLPVPDGFLTARVIADRSTVMPAGPFWVTAIEPAFPKATPLIAASEPVIPFVRAVAPAAPIWKGLLEALVRAMYPPLPPPDPVAPPPLKLRLPLIESTPEPPAPAIRVSLPPSPLSPSGLALIDDASTIKLPPVETEIHPPPPVVLPAEPPLADRLKALLPMVKLEVAAVKVIPIAGGSSGGLKGSPRASPVPGALAEICGAWPFNSSEVAEIVIRPPSLVPAPAASAESEPE